MSLANTGAVPDSSYVSSVTDRFSLVKEHLARMVARLMDCGFDLLAAFAELLAATFALSDAFFCCDACRLFFGTAAVALPSLRLGSARQLWETGGLLQGPVCFQSYLGNFAALVAAMMGAATCLAEEAGRDFWKNGLWILLEVLGR